MHYFELIYFIILTRLSNGEEFITTAQILARMNAKERNPLIFEGSSNDAAVEQEEIVPEEEEVQEQSEKPQNSSYAGKEENSKDDHVVTPQAAREAFLKNSDLNTTFVVSSHRNGKGKPASSSTPSSPPSKCRNRTFTKHSNSALDDISQLDLKFARMQSGKRLTLSDLLNVAKDFNCGKTPEISVDVRNRILMRHEWNINSLSSVFALQLLIFAVLGNSIHMGSALVYLIYLGMLWSSYNCFLWARRYRNFQGKAMPTYGEKIAKSYFNQNRNHKIPFLTYYPDWKLAFASVSMGEWKTDRIEMRFSRHYLLPHLLILSFGSLCAAFFVDSYNFVVLFVSIGTTVVLSIHYGLCQRILIKWQHVVVLSSALVYYQSPLITSTIGENSKEILKFLHQPMFKDCDPTQLKYLPFCIDVFTMLILAIPITTIKFSLRRILSETIPDLILTLWLVKIVQTSVAVEQSDFILGLFVGLAVCFFMMLLCSKLETWKIFLVILSGVLGLILLSTYHQVVSGTQEGLEENEVQYVDWEDYEASCHRPAWNVVSPAATQIKCSTMYGDHTNPLVKWKGRISIVKVEQFSRSLQHKKSLDVVFDISVGIFSSHKDDGSQRNWKNFLSGSSDTGAIAPASVIVKTSDVYDQKKKQDLIDHILNLRTGDRIEFIGKLKGSMAGSLKPQIIEVRSLQCLSCSMADYGEFKISTGDWIKKIFVEIPVVLDQNSLSRVIENSKNLIADFVSKVNQLNVS